jgi:hypothetical protein
VLVFGVYVCLVCLCTVSSSSDKTMHEQGATHRVKCRPSPSLSTSPLVANSANSHTSITGDPGDGSLDDLTLVIVSDCVNVFSSSNLTVSFFDTETDVVLKYPIGDDHLWELRLLLGPQTLVLGVDT